MSVKFNRAALTQLLHGEEMRRFLHDTADPIAASVRADPSVTRHGAEVKVQDWQTDRAVVQVGIDHPAGIGIEGKYHPLLNAARAAGVPVTHRRKADS